MSISLWGSRGSPITIRKVRRSPARGYSLMEIIFVIVIIIVLVALAIPQLGRGQRMARQIRCCSQLRNITQGLQTFAGSNRDHYPMPSALDANNATTREPGRDKDHLANVLSLMIFASIIKPELTVSPAEVNPNIAVLKNYEMTKPRAASRPERALWDPAFSIDFTSPAGGNISYAGLQLSDARLKLWSATGDSNQAILANRGPKINWVTRAADGSPLIESDNASLTHQIHGSRSSWEGHVAYNDGSVPFELRMAPLQTRLPGRFNPVRPDVLFCDDAEDSSRANIWLGMFRRGGTSHLDGSTIWD